MEGADDAVVRFTVNTASLLTSKGLFAAIRAGHRKLSKMRNSGHTSSKRLKKLNKHGQPLEATKKSYPKEDLKVIKRELKKHGVDFALMPCPDHKDSSLLFFVAKDHETINYSIKVALQKVFDKENKQNLKRKTDDLTQTNELKKKPLKMIKSKKKVKSMDVPNL
jgi:hypothetical protein